MPQQMAPSRGLCPCPAPELILVSRVSLPASCLAPCTSPTAGPAPEPSGAPEPPGGPARVGRRLSPRVHARDRPAPPHRARLRHDARRRTPTRPLAAPPRGAARGRARGPGASLRADPEAAAYADAWQTFFALLREEEARPPHPRLDAFKGALHLATGRRAASLGATCTPAPSPRPCTPSTWKAAVARLEREGASVDSTPADSAAAGEALAEEAR